MGHRRSSADGGVGWGFYASLWMVIVRQEYIVFDQGGYRCLAFNDPQEMQSCANKNGSLDFRFEHIKMMFVASSSPFFLKSAFVLPVLPTDLFGNPFDEYQCGTLVNSEQNGYSKRDTIHPEPTPIDGVKLRKRISFAQTLIKPTLDRKNLINIRRVLESSRSFDSDCPCGFMAFQKIHFSHPLFVGSGGLLLDHCHIRNRFSYSDWMAQLYPESMANLYLTSKQRKKEALSNETDLLHLFVEGAAPPRIRFRGWLALGGRMETQWQNPEDFAARCEDYVKLWSLIDRLKSRERSILTKHFGLVGSGQMTYAEIGRIHNLSVERTSQIVLTAMRKIKGWWRCILFLADRK